MKSKVQVPLDPSYVQPSILVEELQKSIQRIEALHMSYIRDVQKNWTKFIKFSETRKSSRVYAFFPYALIV